MKSNITNVFCSIVKARYGLNYDDYWGNKVCDVAHNASIWTELNVTGYDEDGYQDIVLPLNLKVRGTAILIFFKSSDDCKQMKKQSLNDNYGDMNLSGDEFPTFNEQNHMSKSSSTINYIWSC